MLQMQIRPLTTLDECRQVAALERTVWGYADAEDVVPPPVLIVSIKRGGILLGAFDDGGAMRGFVYSMPAIKDGRPTQWSHMLGVMPEMRAAGLGARLKLAQRQAALDMGLDLIEWTYDPLQAGNAHLNFSKLGIVVEEYEENIYGESTSALHRGTPTDRFVAEWKLREPHVVRRIVAAGVPTVRDSSVWRHASRQPVAARGAVAAARAGGSRCRGTSRAGRDSRRLHGNARARRPVGAATGACRRAPLSRPISAAAIGRWTSFSIAMPGAGSICWPALKEREAEVSKAQHEGTKFSKTTRRRKPGTIQRLRAFSASTYRAKRGANRHQLNFFVSSSRLRAFVLNP